MVHPVHDVADVVEPARAQRKIRLMGIRAKGREDGVGASRDDPHMGEAVLRVMERFHRLVLLSDVDGYRMVLPDPVVKRIDSAVNLHILSAFLHLLSFLQSIPHG